MKPLKRIDFAAPAIIDKLSGQVYDDDDDDDAVDDDDQQGGTSSSGSSERMRRGDGSGHSLEGGSSNGSNTNKRNLLPQLVAHATASSSANVRPGPGVNGNGTSMSSTNLINTRASVSEVGAAGGAFGRWL